MSTNTHVFLVLLLLLLLLFVLLFCCFVLLLFCCFAGRDFLGEGVLQSVRFKVVVCASAFVRACVSVSVGVSVCGCLCVQHKIPATK